MEAGPGQSGGNVGKCYFFEEKQANRLFILSSVQLPSASIGDAYAEYQSTEEFPSPYLWAACFETLINRNPKYGAGSYGRQRTQRPDTICLLGIHFCAVHCKDLLNAQV